LALRRPFHIVREQVQYAESQLTQAAPNLVPPEVLVGKALEPLAEFFAGGFFGDGDGDLGAFQDFVL
jgi:hypothetical protein